MIFIKKSGQLIVTSPENLAITSLDILMTSRNDESDWIQGFFHDYAKPYNTTEKLDIGTGLIAGMPLEINFSSKVLNELTIENIRKYIKDMKSDPSIALDTTYDKDSFKSSFLDPKWYIELFYNGEKIGEKALGNNIMKDILELESAIENL